MSQFAQGSSHWPGSYNENPSNAETLDEPKTPTIATLAMPASIKFLWSKPIPMETFHNPATERTLLSPLYFDLAQIVILSLYFYSNTAVNI